MAVRIRALRLRMLFILTQYLAVGLDACSAAVAMLACRRDAVLRAAVLVDPLRLEPSSRIGLVRHEQVELFRVRAMALAKIAARESLNRKRTT